MGRRVNLWTWGLIIVLVLVQANVSFAQYRIMPLGDGITEGATSGTPVGGYRDDLATLLNDGGIPYNFVGTLSSGSGFDADHEGHNGFRADQVDANITGWINSLASFPRIYLLHIGTVDISANQSNSETIQEIENIIDKIHSHDNTHRILLSSLIPRKDGFNGKTTQLNSLILNLYNEKRNAGYSIYYVGHNEVFTANPNWATEYMETDILPNNAGYNLMAEAYFNYIANIVGLEIPRVTDNFIRTNLGVTWVADAAYQIVSNELANTSTNPSWNFLATFISQPNPVKAGIIWGAGVDAAGVGEGALALKLDAPSTTANGYACWYSAAGIRLFEVINGAPTNQLDIKQSQFAFPGPGDKFEVEMSSDELGNHFTVYLNGVQDVIFTDVQKRQGNQPTNYAGVILRGNQNNNVASFELTGVELGPIDETPPDPVTNLAAGTPTEHSVPLTWTATGDDGATGTAAQYDLRYSLGPINNDTDFNAATEVTGEPSPAPAGSQESFVVTGLQSGITYYFAIKVTDDGFNNSTLSNSTSATTIAGETDPPAQITDLAAITSTGNSITVTWSAVGDDGMNGIATSYDVRYSTADITSENDFNAAVQASGEPTPSNPGTQETFIITGLQMTTTYYIAIKALDEESNASPLSNVVSILTLQAKIEYFTDDFNRADLGENWVANPEYQIVNNELANTSTTPQWGYLALHKSAQNVANVSVKWGTGADTDGIEQGGLALKMSELSTTANGYLAWIRPSNLSINVFALETGNPHHRIGSATNLDPGAPVPGPGSVFKVELSSEADGYHFDFYVNDQFAGTVIDINKEYGNAGTTYSGVYLHGSLNNNVDDFTAGVVGESEGTPPAAVIDLSAVSSNGTSITLNWTAVGDDGMVGRASTYDIRYSTNPIVSDNDFNSATQATGEPVPSDPGTQETFIVTGLQSNTTYYLALKVLDDAENVSPLSNVVTIATLAITTIYTTDDFNRTDLGPNWVADAEYQIVNNELANTSTNYDLGWGYIAVYKPSSNPFEVSLKWGGGATVAGIDEGGLLLRLDSLTTTASGYFISAQPTNRTLNLYRIVDSNPSGRIGSEVTMAAGAPTPVAGSVFKVELSSDGGGHHFDCYIDDQYAGRISDPSKEFGNGDSWYCGLSLRGGLANNIDDFTTGIIDILDSTPPSEITNLSVLSSSGTTVSLQWTAVGDDGTEGTAASYDIRYSTDPIQNINDFNQSIAANGEPFPSPAGTQETFVVGGLESNTTYYFAVKVIDDAGNFSLSNSASGTTQAAFIFVDNFNRSQLGPDWNADPQYQIVNNELANTATSSTWGYLAVLTARQNPLEVSFKWGTNATTDGIEQGGVALMLNQANPNASGYSIWIRPSNQTLNLFLIEGGTTSTRVGTEVQLNQASPIPQAGDVFKIMLSSDGNGHHFDCYINNIFAGRVSDANKFYGNSEELYCGLNLKGNLSNNVDNFTVVNSGGTPTYLEYVSGDNQAGKIGTALPGSLIVKVSDQNRIPVAGVNVNFTVVQGSASLDISSGDENVRIEAESGTITPNMEIGDDENASGGKYVYGTSGGAKEGKVEYSFTLPVAGNYNIWGRIYASSGSEDSFFFVVDGSSDTLTWDLEQPYGVWRWMKFKDRNLGDFNQYLNSGAHTLSLLKRENNCRLDKIIFSSDPDFTPSGLEEVEAYITDASGLAKAQLILGNTTGAIIVHAEAFGLEGSPVVFDNLSANAGDATEIVYISGNDQNGTGGQPLPQPFVVKCLDSGGNAVVGWPVTFEEVQGGGFTTDNQPIYTDASGFASTTWTLGTQDETNVVHAVSNGLSGSPIEFNATGIGGIAKTLKYISGNNQSAQINQPVANPLKMKVVDGQGAPIQNHAVIFKVLRGGGTLSDYPLNKLSANRKDDDAIESTFNEKEVLTDVNGFAQVTFTLGDTAGVENQVVEASAMGSTQPLSESPYFFKASANPGNPARLKYVSGRNQTGATGRALGQPFVVQVTDQYGNGIVAHSVSFEVKQGGGSISPSGPWLTEAGGFASVTLTMGQSPGLTNEVWATSLYNGTLLPDSPVIFQATPGIVSKLEYVSGNEQTGSAGYPANDSLKVRVLDNFDNPVSGYPVTFSSIGSANPGTFNGTSNQEVTATTDNLGIAKVSFTCGPMMGINSVVQAILQGITVSPISFNTTVVGLSSLQYVSGNGQTGPVGVTLSQPFKVKAIDALGNSQPNYPITFTVMIGSGNFSGNSTIEAYTDTITHEAGAILTLGPVPGNDNNVAQATAVYNGSPVGTPVTFTASSSIGSANELVEFSGNYQSTKVGNPLSEPFKVKVTDVFGNPIFGHTVNFTVKDGGGTLDGNSLKTVTKITNSSGLAQTILTIGALAGINNNSVEAVAYFVGTQSYLVGSPVTFYASGQSSDASNLIYVSGTGQPVSPVRTAMAAPFKVKMTDSATNPVEGHPVQWSVTQGNGTFGNFLDTTKTTVSDANGFAEVIYYPGPVAGVTNIVKASSTNNTELNGSPITFTAETKAGGVSVVLSEVSATSPVPADNIAQSMITATLMDDYNNKIQGRALTLTVSGSANTIYPFTKATDENGQATAYLSSTKAELKKITIIDILGGITLQDTAFVLFSALDAYSISYVSGTNQSSNFGTGCKDPIVVRVTDIYGNVIKDHEVTFEVYAGGGYIYENQPVLTDENGIASARWVLGPSDEVNRARALASGLTGVVEYIATGNDGTATKLESISGNQQTGIAGKQLPEPVVVQVIDDENDPIANYKVKFKVDYGGGQFNRKSSDEVYTDVFGYAKGYFVLGKVAGSNIASVETAGLTGSPRRFTATGISGPAEKIVKYAGDGSTVQVNGSRWLSVLITDIFDNPVAGYTVTFSVLSGDASIQGGYETATSNAEGIASTLIIGGTTLGQVKVIVLASELIGGGMIFNLSVGARPAVLMDKFQGDQQEGTIGRELVYPLSIVARDDLGNPAGGQNIAITFALTGDHGILLDQVGYTDENGVASARLQLQQATGSVYKVWAINNGLDGSPLEFTVTGVTNKFPQYELIPDYTFEENQTLNFSVNAPDDDGDGVTYGIRNLPAGAKFDSTGTRQFTWTPSYYQAGTYVVHFMAWDNNGGFDDEPVTITVENVNRLPQIINYEPIAYQVVGHLSIGEIFRFMVQVTDEDGEAPVYHWYNDDLLVSMKNYYDCKVVEQTIGSHTIKVEISDGYDTVEQIWMLSIKVPVELASFSGKVVERRGIELSWETTGESNNAGFNIFRKSSRDVEYEKINFRLIQPDETKEYTYFDKDVKVGEYYKYKLEDISLTGERVMHDAIEVFVTKPEKYVLSQNFPNPFNANTHIRYQMPEQNQVSIRIYNLLGQEVITLADEIKEAGYHALIWDGLDKYGNLVGSGIYYYRIVSGSFVQTKKMVLLK